MDLDEELNITGLPENDALRGRLKRKLFSHLEMGGSLESLAMKLGLIQNSEHPEVGSAVLLIFAGDHGIARLFHKDIISNKTEKRVLEFLHGQGQTRRLAKHNNLSVKLVDVGINHSFEGNITYWLHHGAKILSRKVAFGTKNFVEFPAMTSLEVEKAFRVGMALSENQWKKDRKILGLGSFGEAQQFSNVALCCALLNIEVTDDFVKQRSGQNLDKNILESAQKALRTHPKTHDPFTLLTFYGGLETVAICGAILKAAEKKMLVLLDGFTELAALLVASRLESAVLEYVQLCQAPQNIIEKKVVKALKCKPLLATYLKTQDGNGVSLALPLLKNAAALLNRA